MKNIYKILLTLITVAHVHTSALAMQILAHRMAMRTVKVVRPHIRTRQFHTNILRNADITTEIRLQAQLLDMHTNLNKKLLETEQEVIQLLAKDQDVSPEGYTKLIDGMVAIYAQEKPFRKSHLPLDANEVHQKISALLAHLQVAQNSVGIEGRENESVIASSPEKILVNSRKFNILSIKVQKFLTAHELAHILHKDAYYSLAARKLSNDPDLFRRYLYFKELRADMYALSRGIEYAQGAIDYFKLLNHPYSDTHPSSASRLQMALNVHKYFEILLQKC